MKQETRGKAYKKYFSHGMVCKIFFASVTQMYSDASVCP